MLKKLLTALLVLCPLFFGTGAQAQRITDSSYRTIGHAGGVPKKWAAWYFFFS